MQALKKQSLLEDGLQLVSDETEPHVAAAAAIEQQQVRRVAKARGKTS